MVPIGTKLDIVPNFRRASDQRINALKALPFRSSGFLALEDDNISISTPSGVRCLRGIPHNMFFVVAFWKRRNFFLVALVDHNLGKAGRFFVPIAASAV
jgi:hypothetical protein